MSTTPTERFLDAFQQIEAHLRQYLDLNQPEPFMRMVSKAAERAPAFLRMRPALKEFAYIRNFLAHHNRPMDPVANLTERPAKDIEKVRDILLSPPRLVPRFAKDVVICTTDDKLSSAVKRMGENSVSKLPVYRGLKLEGLLVAKTITRWLAHCAPAIKPPLSNVSVEEVLKCQDGVSLYQTMRGDATYFDALRAFEEAAYHKGRHLDAILLTANGTDQEPLQGILTISHLPELLQAITVFAY